MKLSALLLSLVVIAVACGPKSRLPSGPKQDMDRPEASLTGPGLVLEGNKWPLDQMQKSCTLEDNKLVIELTTETLKAQLEIYELYYDVDMLLDSSLPQADWPFQTSFRDSNKSYLLSWNGSQPTKCHLKLTLAVGESLIQGELFCKSLEVLDRNTINYADLNLWRFECEKD
jgi:hypothetical protein